MSRYSKIYRQMWGDAKFRKLSAPQPNAQSLWIRLLSGPELSPVPGLIGIGEAGFAERLHWPLEGFREAFAEVFRQGMVEADWEAQLIWVPNAIHYNEPQSPNVVASWKNAWDELPECELKHKAYCTLLTFLEGFGQAFGEAFRKACRKPSPNHKQEQEQDQEHKQEPEREGADAPARTSVTRLRSQPPPPADDTPEAQSADLPEPAKPESGYAVARRVWDELWPAKYGSPYPYAPDVGQRSDDRVLQNIGRMAAERANGEAWLRHVMRAYLRDHGDRNWLDEHRHPLRTLLRDIASYGEPPTGKHRVAPKQPAEPVAPALSAAEVAAKLGAIGIGKMGMGGGR